MEEGDCRAREQSDALEGSDGAVELKSPFKKKRQRYRFRSRCHFQCCALLALRSQMWLVT